MFRVLTLSLVALSLAGCAAARQRVELTHEKECIAMGYQPGTKLYLQCRALKAQVDTAEQNRITAASMAMISAGAAMTAPPPMPTVTCRTMPNPLYGSTTTCN